MIPIDSALNLAALGFHVFPVVPNSKLPALKDFPNLATNDPHQIEKWWSKNPNYNVGISTTRFRTEEALIAVDIDNKGEKHGDDEIRRLEEEGFKFPDTFFQLTPTGGRHLIFRVPKPLKQGVSVLGPGLDIRSRGGYVVGAGSCIQGRTYTSVGSHIERAPDWLVSRLSSGAERKPSEGKVDLRVDQARARSRAVSYLRDAAPLAVEGSGGDQTTFIVACRVKDFGVEQDTCFQIMLEHWNERCSPPWNPEDLWTKVENAYKHGSEPIGIDAPETQFTPVESEQKKKPPHPFDYFNKKYAYVGGNKGFIVHETEDSNGRASVEYIDVATFHLNEVSKTMVYGEKKVPVSRVWMRSERRRSYDGFCFAPGKEFPKRFYNLWRGFAFTPLSPNEKPTAEHKDSLAAFLEHAKENVCKGDELLANWLIGWFAHLIQKPWQKPLSAIAFRGGKGVGKNALIERVGELLGRHFILVSDPRYLLSNFNSHMENKLLITLDEAFWSGDKKANGILKALVTGKEHLIEHKGRESFSVVNLTRISILGNEDWIVPASEDERRYAVFDVGDGRKKDRKFFRDMRLGMENGGYRLLLRYLLDFDLSGVDVDEAPDTEGLLDQKLRGLEPFARWWLDCLFEGKIVSSDFGNDWPGTVEKDRFRQSFKRYSDERRLGSWLPSNEIIGKQIKKYCPSSSLNLRRMEEGERTRLYKLPPLSVARAEWEIFIGHKMTWESDDEKTEDLFS